MKILSRFRSLIAAFAVLATVLITAPSALAIEGGGIGGRPANPDPSNPRTESIFIYQLGAGTTKTDQVLMMNNTDQEQVITIYAVDGILTNTGAYACEQAVESKDSVGAWVKIAQSEIKLAANTSQKVDFTVTLPQKVDVGEHNGCLVFQSATDEGEVQGNVRVRTRQAIRMAITVPGDLKKDVAIEKFDVDKVNRLQRFLLTISNKGNVSADVDTTTSLRTLWGTPVYSNSGGYPVLANTNLDLNFVNENGPFWGGWYIASAEIKYDARPGVYSVRDAANTVTKSSQNVIVFAIPNPMAFMLYWLVVIAGLIAGFFIYRRSVEKKFVSNWVDYTVKKGETITELAAKYGVDWHLIGRTNNMKAPYTLTKGETIKLPPTHLTVAESKPKRRIKKG